MPLTSPAFKLSITQPSQVTLEGVNVLFQDGTGLGGLFTASRNLDGRTTRGVNGVRYRVTNSTFRPVVFESSIPFASPLAALEDSNDSMIGRLARLELFRPDIVVSDDILIENIVSISRGGRSVAAGVPDSADATLVVRISVRFP